jgi:hypothetical protein
MESKHVRIGLSILFVLGIALAGLPMITSGLSVKGALFSASVPKGGTITHTITISTEAGAKDQIFLLEIEGYHNDANGNAISVPMVQDTSLYSARPFLSLDKSNITVKSGSSVDVLVTAKIPQDVGDGGRYAMITIRSPSTTSGGGVGVAVGANVPVLLTIQGSKILEQGKIDQVQWADGSQGEPSSVRTTFTNTGNYHYKYINEVQLKDSKGVLLFNGTYQATYSILPSSTINISVPVTEELQLGEYTVQSRLTEVDGLLIDEKTVNIEIKQKYVPPFAAVEGTILSEKDSTIVTSDGSVKIDFPAGAVIDTTKVTLKPLPIDAIPRAPNEVMIGGLAFSVDGITGLLSKDATITVKYSSDDMSAAGGDASKLGLARWDKNENKWTIIARSVDKNAGTLTAKTNRFSIWAIMIGGSAQVEQAQTNAGTTKTEGFTAILCFGALGLVLVALRIRRK